MLALWPAAHLLMIDLQVYRAGGEHLLAGTPLYDGGVLLDLPFVYPPFAAIVFVPLTVLPLPVLKFGVDGRGRGAGRVRRAPVRGAGRDAGRPGRHRVARGGAARARSDQNDLLPRPDQRRPARPGARRRHRAACAVARGRGGARSGGEADTARVRRLPAADRPDQGRRHGDGDVRGRRGPRVPRRAGGVGQVLAAGARSPPPTGSRPSRRRRTTRSTACWRGQARPGGSGSQRPRCWERPGSSSRCSPTGEAGHCSG